MSDYLIHYGGEIAEVQVSRRLRVPLEMLEMALLLNDEPYVMHPLGGGLVSARSFVPDTVSVPREITIGPDTHVLTDMGMAGQSFIQGNFRNPNEVSREMDDEGRKLRAEQRASGLVSRLLEIERQRNMAHAADIADRLF